MRRWFQYPVGYDFTVANAVAQTQQLISNDYHFVVQKVVHVATAVDYQLQIRSGNMLFQNGKVYAGSIFGTTQYPSLLAQPLIFLKGSIIYFDITNGATAVNSIQMVFEGYLTDEEVDVSKQWYQYPVETITFTSASEQTIKMLTNNSGYNFVIQKLLAYKSDTAATFKVRMIDANEIWNNDYAQDANLFGVAQRPNIPIQQIMIPKNASLQIDVINGATGSHTVQMCFEGFLVP